MSSRAISLASPPAPSPVLASAASPAARREGDWRLDIQRRAGLFLDHLPGEIEGDRVELHHARALFDARLDAAPLIGVLHGPEAFPRVLRPAQLAPVVGGLLLEAAFHLGDLLDHLRRDHLEVRGAADGALHGAALRGRDAARPAHRHRTGLRPLERDRLSQRLGRRRGALRHEPIHRVVDHRVGDHRMSLFEGQPKDAGTSDPLDLLGHVLHARLGLGRPADGLFGPHVERGYFEARGQQHIARGAAEDVLDVAAQRRLLFRAVDANPAQHDQERIGLARVVDDLLEGLAVEQRLLDLDAFFARHPLRHLEMRLVDLRQPGVDDLLVELILLLEAEDLGGLLGEDVDDAVEDRVVQVGIVDGDGLDLLAELAGQVDGGHERAERLGTAVDADQDRVPLGLIRLGHVLDHPDITVGLAGDPFADRADHAVAGPADAQRADHDQVVLRADHVLEDLGVMLAVHHPRFELDARLFALPRHAVEIAVGDQLQAHRDEAVVDLPLAFQLDLVDVLLGQGVLHLPEAIVVQLRRVDMAADQLRRVGLPQRQAAGDRAVGVVRVVDGNVDALVHRSSERPDSLRSGGCRVAPLAAELAAGASALTPPHPADHGQLDDENE